MANAPVTVLETIQAGIESTPGTGIAATRVVDFDPGKALMKRTIASLNVPRAGARSGTYQVYAGAESVTLEIPTFVSPEDWAWWMNFYLQPLTTGTGAGTSKTYTQTPGETNTSLGSAGAVNSATFEVGGKDTVNTWPTEFQIAGCIGKTFDLTIRPEQLWQAKFVLQGLKTTSQAKTAALSLRTQAAYATGPLTKVYLDTASAFGTTQIVGRNVSADIKFDLKPAERRTTDGTTTPYRLALPDAYLVNAKVSFEFSSVTEYNNWTAKTAERLQIAYVGPSISGGGFQTVQLNLGGVWNTVDIVADKGVFVATMQLDQLYDSSISAAFQSIAICTVSPLP